MQGRIVGALYAASNAQQLPGSAGLAPRDGSEPPSDRLPAATSGSDGRLLPKTQEGVEQIWRRRRDAPWTHSPQERPDLLQRV